MSNEIKYFSMFTGIGGFELGFSDKFKCVGFSEIDKKCCELLSKKFNNIKNYGNATKINADELPDFDLLCAGFPCQAFSIAGKRRGFQDTRGNLFFEIARIIKFKRPGIIFLENVKGLLNHKKGETFKIIIQSLEKLGYDCQWLVINSKFFGVPQNRERVFIIGNIRARCPIEILPFRKSSFKTDKTKMKLLLKNKSQANRIYYTDSIAPTISGASKLSGDNTIKIYLNSATKRGYSIAQIGDGIRLEYPESKTARGRVIRQISNTLKKGTEGVIDFNGKIRKLTPLEYERLQGFPDNWTQGFSDNQRYKMIGNAVTVNVISSISEKIENYFIKGVKC